MLMTDLFKLILGILALRFKARATLEAKNLVLRQQVNVRVSGSTALIGEVSRAKRTLGRAAYSW